MFEGFSEERVEGEGAEIFLRRGGAAGAPPVLLLHGYPQTSAMWARTAAILARDFEVVCADLRGYGRSGKPPTDAEHAPYSKRAMAADMVAMMRRLGHERFFLAGHDRGGRVSHRLGMDHPGAPIALAVLDIAPTREMYAETDMAFAAAYWHWFFLIQKAPLPETMIGADPRSYWKFKCMKQSGGAIPFAPEALEEYLSAFEDPATIHASCEDYRAAASIDIAHDDADGGRKLAMPMLALWARGRVVDRCFDPLALWRKRADIVEGEAMEGTHYLPEDDPEGVAERLKNFFLKHS